MILLEPNTAARIAAGAYLVQDTSISDLMANNQELGCESQFDVGNSMAFSASTGLGRFQAISGFGYIAPATGTMRGEYLIAFRGTQLLPFDGLTDLDCRTTRADTGHHIHSGFKSTFETQPNGPGRDILRYFRGKDPTRVHIVGHSLGGALATLAAELVAGMGVSEVLLYTFGSPRVGNRGFAEALNGAVGPENIYRVFHPADPVPMLPVFPFAHVPAGNAGYAIDPQSNMLVSVGRHSTVNSYVPGTAGTSWGGLRAGGRYVASHGEVERWLVNAALSGSFMGSASLLTMIGTALQWILVKVAQVAGSVVTIGFTALDRIASILAAGMELGIDVAIYVQALVRAIFRFLGRTIATGVRLSTAFLRWVLGLLFNAISTVANRAVNLLS